MKIKMGRKKEGGTSGDDAAAIIENDSIEDPEDWMNPDNLQFPDHTLKHL